LGAWAIASNQAEKAAEKATEQLKEQAEEARTVADEAKTEVDSVQELYESYLTLKSQYEASGEGKDDYFEATKSLCEALGIEVDYVDLLTGSYENLTATIAKQRAEKAQAAIEDEKAVIDAQKDLVKDQMGQYVYEDRLLDANGAVVRKNYQTNEVIPYDEDHYLEYTNGYETDTNSIQFKLGKSTEDETEVIAELRNQLKDLVNLDALDSYGIIQGITEENFVDVYNGIKTAIEEVEAKYADNTSVYTESEAYKRATEFIDYIPNILRLWMMRKQILTLTQNKWQKHMRKFKLMALIPVKLLQ